ncbi:hypothetical protein NW767_004812 [Fusarium falciforme]|uniref:RNA polymerase I-specific transcription initiation factor RRN6-like protein n=1 Tax=Fusarium falciforme TaxID=195108 RepID=A0A9W8R4N9_9HYPO|nr:hypothetical protein NW755_008003 [Fusarium falciforme]KAJ4203952.1 hypothetical protein NW767_004812 [Fusarium falciforme]
MAEARRLTDLIHGHVGRLTYISPENATSQLGSLHTSRVTSEAPHFRVIGSSAELYPPSKSSAPEVSSNLWQERRTQRRWLLQSHPEAFVGNSALQELLEENMNRYSKVEGEAVDRPLLSIGQMTNVADSSRVKGALMLAAVTGESGELLRLARVDESKWQWDHNKDTVLHLSVIDPEDPDEEAIWASDGLPISQVKFATSLTRYDAVRWVIVQKQTSTTILQPEYHKVPVAQPPTADLDAQQQRLSRIDPNPIVTLSHKKTGSNAQVDVAFNPNSKGQHPQMAIIDECGYWSVWDVIGNKNTRLALQKCGHISEGLLNELPSTTESSAEKHGILFVGTAKVDSFWEDATQGDDDDANGFASRSSHLLLWNREKYEVIDMASNMALPQLPILTPLKGKPDSILDVRISPVNQNHIFILTMQNLFWIDLFAPNREEDEPSKPTILATSPHLLDGEGLRITACRASEENQDSTMVFTFSPTHRQLHTYWFGHSKDKNLPQWHREVLTLPHENTAAPSDIQSLEIRPAKLTQNGASATGTGFEYLNAGVQFYQGTILNKDLGVRYCICASAKDRDMQIVLPTGRIKRSKTAQAKRWRKKRNRFLRHMGEVFVLPDSLADTELAQLVQPHSHRSELDSINLRESSVFGPVHLKLDFLCRALLDNLMAVSMSSHDIPPALLSAIQEHIAEGTAEGRLSLRTWKEIGQDLDQLQLETDDGTAQINMLDLFLEDDGQAVVTQLGRQTSKEWVRELISLSHLNQTYVGLWLDQLEGRLPNEDEETRRGWIADLAKDMFLATAGVMVQDTPLLGSGSREIDEGGVHYTQIRSSSIPIKASQSSDAGIPSSPISTTPNETNDATIRRLQLLAPSLRLDKMASAKQSSVLSYWPTERGVGTEDYVSSVAVASDKKFDDARQRLQRIETKRKAHAEKYKLPAFMRQGGSSQRATQGSSQVRPPADEGTSLPALPAQPVQIMSSQQRVPESSQSQGLLGPAFTMSQPVSGVFGDRKKVKKGKRKSGFR